LIGHAPLAPHGRARVELFESRRWQDAQRYSAGTIIAELDTANDSFTFQVD
jgi:hypothetical protein